MSEQNRIFREKALERLSSPESLDQLMRVTSARDWISLCALGALTIVFVVWSVVGRLPTSVTGRGILIHPFQIVDCRATEAGRLESLNVKPGDAVKKGDL